jgi:hypothetical protein
LQGGAFRRKETRGKPVVPSSKTVNTVFQFSRFSGSACRLRAAFDVHRAIANELAAEFASGADAAVDGGLVLPIVEVGMRVVAFGWRDVVKSFKDEFQHSLRFPNKVVAMFASLSFA